MRRVFIFLIGIAIIGAAVFGIFFLNLDSEENGLVIEGNVLEVSADKIKLQATVIIFSSNSNIPDENSGIETPVEITILIDENTIFQKELFEENAVKFESASFNDITAGQLLSIFTNGELNNKKEVLAKKVIIDTRPDDAP